MSDDLRMWTIVRDPADLPGIAFSARLWIIEAAGPVVTDQLLTAHLMTTCCAAPLRSRPSPGTP